MKEYGVADAHTHTLYSGFSKYSFLSYPEQDGIAFAPHPFSVYCSCLGKKLHGLKLDGIEVFNS